MTTALLLIALGGTGAMVRFALAQWAAKLPWGILLANTLAAIGACAALATLGVDSTLTQVLIAGFAGGLSTFSTVIADSYKLWTSGARAKGAINTLANLAIPSTAGALTLLIAFALLK